MTAPDAPPRRRVAVLGGGAAGFFGAIACAEADPAAEVTIFEATAHPLAKVRVSGGGRCNVTHACFDPRELASRYPRGARELIGPLHRFGPRETVAWFLDRGVALKTEPDGRMFPVTDDSGTIAGCLLDSASRAGIHLRCRCGVASAAAGGAGWVLTLTNGETLTADGLLVATGGNRGSTGLAIAAAAGHAIAPPVASLFTFHIDDARLRGLEGLAAPAAEVSVAGTALRADGPVLVTHWGLSGPAILRLSSLGARELHARNYAFTILVNWAPGNSPAGVAVALEAERAAHPSRRVITANPFGIPSRLWERLAGAAGLPAAAIWSGVSNPSLRSLAAGISSTHLEVAGKSTNKEEFVTCGGVVLREINFATMESRLKPGLHFAGEVIDVDGITGGYNFQAAWTTGWHAGRALGGQPV